MTEDSASGPIVTADPLDAVRTFFRRLGEHCRAVDFDAAMPMFADDVASFGTKARVVRDLAPLRANQWEGIWPNIADFRFDLDAVHGSGAGGLAWGMAPWTSTGFHPDGTPFERPGRATVVLERRGEVWVSVHTHFSLAPGTPTTTHGRKG